MVVVRLWQRPGLVGEAMTVAIFTILTVLALILMLANAAGWGIALLSVGFVVFLLVAGQDIRRDKGGK